MLSYAKSGIARTGDRLNGFKNGTTQQFNSGGVVKWAYFQKKWSIPLILTDANIVFNGVQQTYLCSNLRKFGLGFHDPLTLN